MAAAVTARSRWVAPVLDAVALAVFVLLGRRSHGLQEGATWFVEVLWPFLLGWAGFALLTRLYTATSAWLARWAVVLAGCVTVAMLIRAVVQDKAGLSAFTWVSAGVIALLTLGWRAVARVVARRHRVSVAS